MILAKLRKMRNTIVLLSTILIILFQTTAFSAERYQVIQYGDKDEYVARLQAELHARGYLESDPTGYFGKETEEAVWNYQSRKGLQADGKAGIETQKAIFGKYYEDIPESRKVGEGSSESSRTSSSSSESSSTSSVIRYQVMLYGDNDKYVLRLQEELYARGYLEAKPTGYFGKDTQNAVARYQERNDLDSDGKAGVQTQKKLFGKYYEPIPESRKVSDVVDTNKTGGSVDKNPDSMRNGDEGSKVEKIQKRLKELGYYSYKTTNYYGDITEQSVVSFQGQNGLNADGVAGKRTQDLLFSSKAKKYKKGSSKENSSSKVKNPAVKKQTTDGKASAKNITISAQNLIGKSYRTGGTGPNTFDCSGYIYYILKGYGISTPRTSRDMSQYSAWTNVSNKSDLEAGDLVFFTSPGSGSGVGHAGIYLGGGKFIHSSSGSAKGVTISNLNSGSYAERYINGRRIFK